MTNRSRDLPHDHQERWARAQTLLGEFIAAGGSLNTSLHGVNDRLEELKRFLAGDDPALAELLAEMADDEVALLSVWVRQPNKLGLPREIAGRFEQIGDRERRRIARRAQLWAAYEEAAQDPSFASTEEE